MNHIEKLIETRIIEGRWVAYPPTGHTLCYGIGATEEEAIGQLWKLFGETLLLIFEKAYRKEIPMKSYANSDWQSILKLLRSGILTGTKRLFVYQGLPEIHDERVLLYFFETDEEYFCLRADQEMVVLRKESYDRRETLLELSDAQ